MKECNLDAKRKIGKITLCEHVMPRHFPLPSVFPHFRICKRGEMHRRQSQIKYWTYKNR